jgi:hypothetical protein
MLNYQIILTVSTAVVIVNIGVATFIKRAIFVFTGRRLKRLKPLDCALCLSFWITLIFQFIEYGVTFESIGVAFFAALIGEAVHRLINLIPTII